MLRDSRLWDRARVVSLMLAQASPSLSAPRSPPPPFALLGDREEKAHKLGSVLEVAPGTGFDSPVRMERSNLRSLEHWMRRTSAGTLVPSVILTTSPETSSEAGNLKVLPSRQTRTSEGRRLLIEDMTLPVV